jgi:hypothetical protein
VQDRAGRGVAALFRVVRRSGLVGLILAFTLIPSVSARQATTVATPTAIDPGGRTTAPLSNDRMRELIETGLPTVLAFIAGTPTARGDATPLPRTGDGEPADEATVTAVTDVVFQFVACTNAGNLPAAAALLTEQGAVSYLGFVILPFREIYSELTGTPTMEVDPDLINTFLATLQLRAPIPAEFQTNLYGIESVTQLDDGRVQVIALMATGSEEPSETSIVLRKEDGRYRMIFGRDTGIGAPSTPEP